MNSRGRQAVILEGWSVLLALASARAISACDTVYVARRIPLREPSARRRAIVTWIVARLNRCARLVVVPLEAFSDEMWLANRAAVDEATALESRIRQSPVYRAVRTLVGSDLLVAYFQGALTRKLPNAGLFAVQARHVSASHDSVIAVLTWATRVATSDRPIAAEDVLQRLADSVQAWQARFLLLAVPFGFIARRLRFGLSIARPRSYLAAVPVVWGVQSASNSAEVRRPHDDLYIYGGALAAGDIVHVFGDWRFDAATEIGYAREFARRGLPTADKARFGLHVKTLLLALRATGTLARIALHPRPMTGLDALLLQESAKAIYYWLSKQLECAHLRYKVEVVKNDYNPGHVINTIVARRHGTVSVGVQHAASPYDAPQLAFVCFDRYIVYGEMYVRAFGAHWSGMTLERTGRESVDWVAEAVSPRRRTELRRRWVERHGAHAKTVLVLFPGSNEICLRRQWDRLYEGLASLVGHPGDFTVILRFRNAASLRSPEAAPFATLPDRDARFVIELTEFTTYELMAVSDVVIAGEASFTVNEAIAAVPVVFTFEYAGTARYYFEPYGRDFVLRTAADVRRVIDALDGGFNAFDCRWDTLRRDANFHADGDNRRRMREVVEHAALSTEDPRTLVSDTRQEQHV